MKQKKISALKRVLIVDDDQDIRLALRALLRDAGYEVIGEAPDGMKAMALVEKHKPSIVLLDILMPGTSGLDVLVEVLEGFPLTKVVMISSDATSDHVTTALERGASGFIVKPFNFNNVLKNIERALVEAAAAAKLAKAQPQEDQPGLLEQNEQKAKAEASLKESKKEDEKEKKESTDSAEPESATESGSKSASESETK